MSDQTTMFDLPEAPAVAASFDLPDGPGEATALDLPDAPADQDDRRVLEATEILEPEALVPVEQILARVEGITAADVARSIALAGRALQIRRIASDDEQDALDELRDDMKAHEAHVRARVDGYCDIANRLHKGMTGLRNLALDRVPDAIKHAGSLIAGYIREKEAAEAERQRQEREVALRQERERLKAEAEAAEAERRRIAAQAAAAKSEDEARALRDQASQLQRDADQARVEAATVTSPAVAARPVGKPTGATARDNWKALPEHAEAWADLSAADKIALLLHVAERCLAKDYSLVNLFDVNVTSCNQQANSQKSLMKIPGIRAVNLAVYSKRR